MVGARGRLSTPRRIPSLYEDNVDCRLHCEIPGNQTAGLGLRSECTRTKGLPTSVDRAFVLAVVLLFNACWSTGAPLASWHVGVAFSRPPRQVQGGRRPPEGHGRPLRAPNLAAPKDMEGAPRLALRLRGGSSRGRGAYEGSELLQRAESGGQHAESGASEPDGVDDYASAGFHGHSLDARNSAGFGLAEEDGAGWGGGGGGFLGDGGSRPAALSRMLSVVVE